ncbi:MAG: ABC transporter permease [Mycobacteriaceae bacterium]|uniref:ABC transporter permease n=1 Tax=Corynebacterium sp. TaxID=1720 RepID=UPI003F956126
MSTATTTVRFALHDLRRLRRDVSMLFFSMVLPVVFYLVFGQAMGFGDDPIGNGNVKAYIMIGMALYAGITGATAAAGQVVVESQTGWGRQLALTPLTGGQILTSRLLGITIRAILPVLAVFAVGALTGADMPYGAWVGAGVLCVVGSIPFGFYGMIWTQLWPTETSVGVASTTIVILAFLGNMFMPLPEAMMGIGRFTPLYGVVSLARWPLTDGAQSVQFNQGEVTDPLWWALVNFFAWSALFIVVVLALHNREKGRQ